MVCLRLHDSIVAIECKSFSVDSIVGMNGICNDPIPLPWALVLRRVTVFLVKLPVGKQFLIRNGPHVVFHPVIDHLIAYA